MKTITLQEAVTLHKREVASREKQTQIMMFAIIGAMITSSTIVPRRPSEFNSYIQTCNNYQLKVDPVTHIAGFTRMGWSAQNSTDWDSKTTAWIALYTKFTDALQCTSTIKKNVRTFIKDFATFAAKPILKTKGNEGATEEDAKTFHFVLVRKKNSTSNPELTAECFGNAYPAGLGKLRLKVKTFTDSKRASILPGADGMEFDYAIYDTNHAPDVGGIPKIAPDDIYIAKFSKKASIIYDFGIGNSGKIVQIFFRWSVTGKPELSGPWGQMITIRIP